MRTLSDLIADIKIEIQQTPVHNQSVLAVLGFEIAEKAKSMIGTHQIFWKDLKPSTIDQKSKKGQGKGGDPSSPLYATGDFERSVEYRVLKNKVRIFSKDPTAVFHEYGTAKQPPRPVFKPAAMLVLKEFMTKNMMSGFYLKKLR